MNKRTIFVFTLSTIIVLLAVLWAGLKSQGYRISLNPFNLITPGTLVVTGIESSDSLLVDDYPKRARIENGTANVSVPSGERDIIVARPGHFPYAKTLIFTEGEMLTLHPLFLPLTPLAQIISYESSDGAAIKNLIDNREVPTADNPRRAIGANATSNDVTVAFVADNSIIAVWQGSEEHFPEAFCRDGECARSITVATIASPITSLEFYPGRDDVILFATEGDIYAIEIDQRPVQNFQVVYTSEDPTAFITVPDRNALYLTATSSLLLIELPE